MRVNKYAVGGIYTPAVIGPNTPNQVHFSYGVTLSGVQNNTPASTIMAGLEQITRQTIIEEEKTTPTNLRFIMVSLIDSYEVEEEENPTSDKD